MPWPASHGGGNRGGTGGAMGLPVDTGTDGVEGLQKP